MRSRYPAPSPTHHSQSHRQRQPTTPSIPCTHPRPYTHMVFLAIVQVQREATTLPGCCTTNHRSPCMRRVVLLQDPSHVLTTVEVEPDTHSHRTRSHHTVSPSHTHTPPLPPIYPHPHIPTTQRHQSTTCTTPHTYTRPHPGTQLAAALHPRTHTPSQTPALSMAPPTPYPALAPSHVPHCRR